MEQELQAIDWTLECLEDKKIQRFKNRVVWPAINLLYRQKYKVNFSSYENLGEEFELEEDLVTPDGDKSIKVWLEADCEAENHESSAADLEIVGSVTIGLDERLVDAEEFLVAAESDLQVWKSTSYSIDSVNNGEVYIESYYKFVHPEHGTLEDLDEHQIEALGFLGENTESEVLTRLDCIDIANIFIELGVPEKFIDKRMRRFTSA